MNSTTLEAKSRFSKLGKKVYKRKIVDKSLSMPVFFTSPSSPLLYYYVQEI